MISQTLLTVIIVLTLFSYGYILILYLISKDKESNRTGSELALKILDNDYEIKVIESKGKILSTYSLKRKMIRLSTKTYYGKDYFSLYVAYILSGYEIVRNKYTELISKIFQNIRVISFSVIIICLISIITNNSIDSKFAIIASIIISVYQYIIYNIQIKIKEEIKEIDKKILAIFDKMLVINKLFFITSLIAILRFVIIILNI